MKHFYKPLRTVRFHQRCCVLRKTPNSIISKPRHFTISSVIFLISFDFHSSKERKNWNIYFRCGIVMMIFLFTVCSSQSQEAIKEEHKSYYAISTAHVYGQEKYLLVNNYLAYRNLHFSSVCVTIEILHTFLWKSILQTICSYIMHLSHMKSSEIWPLLIMSFPKKGTESLKLCSTFVCFSFSSMRSFQISISCLRLNFHVT